jgi:hypothetical protein
MLELLKAILEIFISKCFPSTIKPSITSIKLASNVEYLWNQIFFPFKEVLFTGLPKKWARAKCEIDR